MSNAINGSHRLSYKLWVGAVQQWAALLFCVIFSFRNNALPS